MKDKQFLLYIQDLKALYKENYEFLNREKERQTDGYSKETIDDFKKLNSQLLDYIGDIQHGLECDKTIQEWRDFFRDILLEDKP